MMVLPSTVMESPAAGPVGVVDVAFVRALIRVAPVATLAGLLSANLRNLAYGLQQLADKKAAAGT